MRVYYSILSGNVTDLERELELATARQDFLAEENFLDIPDGENFGHLPLTIYDDSVPEVREVFLVNLTGKGSYFVYSLNQSSLWPFTALYVLFGDCTTYVISKFFVAS